MADTNLEFCAACGRKVALNAQFCAWCGANLARPKNRMSSKMRLQEKT
jgi:rRNA maturation endonuclease Nob1